ncbi:MAG: hypothetical protein LUI12_01895 [Clostridiales bacterium]|nr:hypothetical protein [Clostridiales bacterium]
MNTKTYLSQIERLDRMIQNKLSEIYQLKTMACSVTVANDGERVKTSSDKDRLGNTVAKIVDLEKETDILVDELIAKKKYITSQIEGIEDVTYYHILFNKYVARKDLVQIAKEIPCSYRQATRYHVEALIEFEKKYGKEYL